LCRYKHPLIAKFLEQSQISVIAYSSEIRFSTNVVSVADKLMTAAISKVKNLSADVTGVGLQRLRSCSWHYVFPMSRCLSRDNIDSSAGPRGGRVHYTRAAAKASNDRGRSLAIYRVGQIKRDHRSIKLNDFGTYINYIKQQVT